MDEKYLRIMLIVLFCALTVMFSSPKEMIENKATRDYDDFFFSDPAIIVRMLELYDWAVSDDRFRLFVVDELLQDTELRRSVEPYIIEYSKRNNDDTLRILLQAL